jgi:hypothetical protein
VIVAVDLVAHLVAAQPVQQCQHVVGQLQVQFLVDAIEELIFFARSFIHPGEADGFGFKHDQKLPSLAILPPC